MARLVMLVALALTFASDAAAQRTRPRTQRVDPLTASIRGKVTTADTGAPVRGAEVRLSSDGRFSRLVTSDGDGRYELRDLPAGQFKLVVSRTGFITLQFGQRRPFEASTTINLREGEEYGANVALIRGGAIYGRLTDAFGDPAAGIRVQVLRSRMVQGSRRLQSVGPGDQTDDTGAFRVYGLPPGDYFVAASGSAVDAVKRDPPIYYPGSPSLAEAQRITLGVGAEATADFQMASVPNARISGVVLNSSGAPAPGAMVNLNSGVVGLGPNVDGSTAAFQIHADAALDGSFRLENVPPGPYTLSAMLPFASGFGAALDTAAASGRPALEAMNRVPETVFMPIVMTGDNMTDITLVTRPGGRLTGRFVADTGVVRPLPSGVRVSLRSGNGGGVTMSIGNSVSIANRDFANRDFQLAGMTGPFHLEVENVPDGWAVKSLLLDGTDVTDEPIELNGEGTIRIVLTDRVTLVGGTIQSRSAAATQSVIVFPDDETKWTWPTRYVKSARADEQGQFQIRGLPAGDRYLAAAVDYLEDGDEQDPQFLERLRNRATSFSLNEGEQRALQLDPIAR